ncbi:MAG: ferredoxin reductase family protein [Hyphomicrobiaceae bacterium]
MNPIFLILVYILVILLPLGLAWSNGWPARFYWDELASGAGMLAFGIVLVEFVLSGRFRTVSRRIGMDVTMRFHQLIARTALGLMLLHPFLYQSTFNPPRPWDATRQLTLTFDIESLGSGILAWVLFPAFILLAIGRKQIAYRYETWRLMHGLGALTIAALILHHTIAAGRYAQDPKIASIWIAMFAIALFSLVYVYLAKPFWQRRKAWVVQSVRPAGLKTWELNLDPVGHGGLSYRAGQFVWLNVGHSSFSLRENPFSISSAPASGASLQFLIKELGDFTDTVGRIAPGTTAYVDGPHGNLLVSDRDEPGIALIAGGVGIAPLLGILRQLHLEKDQRPTMLVYGNRIAEQIVHGDELSAYERSQGTQVHYVLSQPPENWSGETGIIDCALVRRVFDAEAMKTWLFVLCGPSAMMKTVENTLIELGVPGTQILSERFDYD